MASLRFITLLIVRPNVIRGQPIGRLLGTHLVRSISGNREIGRVSCVRYALPIAGNASYSASVAMLSSMWVKADVLNSQVLPEYPWNFLVSGSTVAPESDSETVIHS